MEQEVYKAQEDRISERYDGKIADYEAEIMGLQSSIDTATAARDEKVAIALAEADGSGGSGIRNMGPIYRAKKAEADLAQAELDAIVAANVPAIRTKEANVTELKTKIEQEISQLERGAFGGMAARIDALDRLGQRSDAIYYAAIFITLLFIAIETAPIFTKLISPRSPYDYLLAEKEHVYEMEAKESTTRRASNVKHQLMIHTEVGFHEAKSEVKARKAEIDADLRERLSAAEQRVLRMG